MIRSSDKSCAPFAAELARRPVAGKGAGKQKGQRPCGCPAEREKEAYIMEETRQTRTELAEETIAMFPMGEMSQEEWMRENFGNPTIAEDLPQDDATESIIIEFVRGGK